ncbi:hypothetical protein ES332_D07G207900v1 [Gossypium tomentosum]|uniref:Uncharacterized protein n=1 Tax=Gossypium tomentosum TaxID=34277 RepID=A0A5D2KA84_GOSTO|nr:hypothetical protein ES332_D07G207900v1 [Gossypium tomentosum]
MGVDERQGGAVTSKVWCSRFRYFFFNHGFIDLGVQGPKFTWSKGRLFQRLDRSFCNGDWQSYAPNTTVRHLYKLKSDHRPLLVSTNPERIEKEELYWFQKSRSEWLFNGDRNTAFFHNRTLKRRQQNNIEALLIEGTGWCFDNDMLRWHATDYFSKLYTVDNYLTGSFPIRGHFLKLETNVIRELLAKVTEEEVRCSVFSMSPLKAPEADGFHAKFYQANWEQNQSHFIASRNISDNIIIAQESIHTMKTTKSKKGWMVVKVDDVSMDMDSTKTARETS